MVETNGGQEYIFFFLKKKIANRNNVTCNLKSIFHLLYINIGTFEKEEKNRKRSFSIGKTMSVSKIVR